MINEWTLHQINQCLDFTMNQLQHMLHGPMEWCITVKYSMFSV